MRQGARHCVRPPTATVERRTLPVRAAGSQLVRSNTLRSSPFAAERPPSANIGAKQNYKLRQTPRAPASPSRELAAQRLLLLGCQRAQVRARSYCDDTFCRRTLMRFCRPYLVPVSPPLPLSFLLLRPPGSGRSWIFLRVDFLLRFFSSGC